ncbi:MAG: hypothetical protein JRJ82_13505 [Deltaproteobacteria bacterium]|nr:hypothetical protein [Deltaproteobacteria bacterium]
MKRISSQVRNEEGSVLVLALIILVLLTIIGISTSTTSEMDIQIAGNDKLYKNVLYTADAGIEHVRAMLNARLMLSPANASRIAQGLPPLWTFALDGSQSGIAAATDGVVDGEQDGDFEGGAVWINNAGLGKFNYTVTVWNNADGAGGDDFDTDTDSILWARSEATGPGGSSVTIEVSLLAEAEGTAYTGYTAQAGAGAGKSYSSDDLNAMTDFSTQL